MEEVKQLTKHALNERHKRVITYLEDSLSRLYENSTSISSASQWCNDEAIPNIAELGRRCVQKDHTPKNQVTITGPYVAIIKWYTSKIEAAPGGHLEGHGTVLYGATNVNIDELSSVNVDELEQTAVRPRAVRHCIKCGCAGRPRVG